MTYDPYAHNDDDGKDHPDDLYEDSLAANVVDDDGEMDCGLCGRRVTLTGLCRHCDGIEDDVEANTTGDIG